MSVTPQVIDPLHTPVPTTADPVNFDADADAFLSDLPVFAIQSNQAAQDTYQNALDAEAAAQVSEGAASVAASLVNFRGPWASLTGSLAPGASVAHVGRVWVLLTPLANVAASEPGVTADWLDPYGVKLDRDGGTATDLTVESLTVEGGASIEGGLTIEGAVVEEVHALTGTTPVISAANGTIQTWSLTANSAPTYSLNAGESVTLMIDDGTARTITWPTTRWVGGGGLAPVLETTGYNVITLWRVGADVFGSFAGAG